MYEIVVHKPGSKKRGNVNASHNAWSAWPESYHEPSVGKNVWSVARLQVYAASSWRFLRARMMARACRSC